MAKQALSAFGSKSGRRTWSVAIVASCGVEVRRKIWLAAALIALAGCGQPQQQQQSGQAAPPGSAELRAAASDPRVAGFYRSRGWRTAWTRDSEGALTAAIGE